MPNKPSVEVDYLLLLADGERHYGFQQELIPGEAPKYVWAKYVGP